MSNQDDKPVLSEEQQKRFDEINKQYLSDKKDQPIDLLLTALALALVGLMVYLKITGDTSIVEGWEAFIFFTLGLGWLYISKDNFKQGKASFKLYNIKKETKPKTFYCLSALNFLGAFFLIGIGIYLTINPIHP